MNIGDDRMSQEDLIKKIDEKIAQLEKIETPNALLKKALIKKGFLSKNTIISQEEIDRLFEILEKECKNRNS